MRKIRFKIIILNLCKLFKSVLVKLNTPDSLAIGKNTIENFLINEFGLKSNEIFKLNSFVTSRIRTKVFDCFIFDNEIELLDLRLNEYYDKIDFFIIIEFSKTNTGYIKETSIFEKNINIWKKFSDKILYKYVNFNEIPNFSESKNNNIEIFCKNYIDIILRKIASSGDNIFISDIGQLWNIDKIEEACTSDGIVLFVQNWYDYFINYKRNNYLIGTFKYNYGTLSLQEARNLAFKINNYIVHKDMRNIIEISNLTYSTYFKLICDGGGVIIMNFTILKLPIIIKMKQIIHIIYLIQPKHTVIYQSLVKVFHNHLKKWVTF